MTRLQAAIEAAEAAGRVLAERLPQTRTVTFKGARDIVTDADVAAQAVVAALVAERFPGEALLGEEGPHTASLSGPGPVWVVDPLDGTTNYSRRHPGFAVAVAVAEAGRVQVAVTHDPLRHETFYAERGHGAFVRAAGGAPQPLQVSATSAFSQALVGLDWSRAPAIRRRVLESVGRVGAVCYTLRALGSTALALAYVAAGRLDAYFNLAAAPWDVAAGVLLVSEAGGRVSAPSGDDWQLAAGGLAASNGALHPAFIQLLGPAPA